MRSAGRREVASTLAIALGFAALVAAAVPVSKAETWTRSGPKGSATRSFDQESGTYSVNRSGINGGSTSATVNCARGGGLNCTRDYSVTSADGRTATGTRQSRYGLYRGGSVNTLTGPDGQTVTRARPTWRYNRSRRIRRW
ncbi:MAG: hypothetical protein AAFP17_11235 [Pseudomonadota bacterium]